MDHKIILVVEDEDIIRRLFKRLLIPLGHEIVCARGVREGKEKMDLPQLDLLITDLKLPDGSGIDVIRQFKARFPNSKILIVTGSLTPEEQLAKASEWGVSDCIYKPFKVEEFIKAVQNVLKAGISQN